MTTNSAGVVNAGGNATVIVGNISNSGPPTANELKSSRIIPFPRNEDIIVRSKVFAHLEKLLPPSSSYQSAALWGLGGSGKTQIALEYAYLRCSNPICSVFWVHADNETAFMQDYKKIAKKLGLGDGLQGEDLLAAVRERIEAESCWVLILDNADDLAVFGVGQAARVAPSLRDFVPCGPQGTVLWTSRDKRITGTLVGAQRAIEVARMTDNEAMKLFETVRNEKVGDGEADDAVALLAQLEQLPLAISQAAAYLRRTARPIKEYVSRLQRKERKVLEKTESDRHRRPHVSNSILETWNISVEHLQQDNATAYKVLHIQAFLDNENIPFEMIEQAAAFGKEAPDYDDVVEAVTRLLEFSFLSQRQGERAYEMHKLVQEALQYRLTGAGGNGVYFAHAALQVVARVFPETQRELWDMCEKYLTHAQRVGEWAELSGEEMETSAVLTRVSNYLYDRGRWRERELVDIRMLNLQRKILGEKHANTISSKARLAVTYYMQGRYNEAEKISVDVLALRRDVLGERHPDTIGSMASLASTYYMQGKYDEAEKISVDGLTLLRKVLGEGHFDTIGSMPDIAAIYSAQGKYDEAEKISVDGLALLRKVLGERHPDTIGSMPDIAAIYSAQGRYDEAEKIKVDVLALRREVLGERHPDTIWSMANLAATYHAQGRYNEAEKIHSDALKLRREVLGKRHPYTLSSMHYVAKTWHVQGRTAEAEVMMKECFQQRCIVLGANHPDTRESARYLSTWK